jgi:hypothetical protein
MSHSDDIGNYLTMGDSPDEEMIRCNLAKLGPSSVTIIVLSTLSKLRNYRSGLEHFFAGQFAAMGIKQAFRRACKLLIEIVNSSPQGGSDVGKQLGSLIEHLDPGIRALAILFAGLPGVPFTLTVTSLQQHFLTDEDLVVKMAAAVFLQSHHEATTLVPDTIQTAAQAFAANYIKQLESVSGFSDDDLEDEDEKSVVDSTTKQIMVNTDVVLELLPQMIALQLDEY